MSPPSLRPLTRGFLSYVVAPPAHRRTTPYEGLLYSREMKKPNAPDVNGGSTTFPLNLNRLGEPFFESHCSEHCVVLGNECPFGHLYAVIRRLRVNDNFSRIVACGESVPDQFIEAELFRATYFDDAIYR